ncbi:Electron transport complex protein RnfG [hydrothermal vent metagenome]|uniref:Electron transport complex protein RnfG n=1 Tax=hydrothermal vent metagenome TaxID=652676 RepID=A0A3B1ACE3_9ZZZZ
MFLKNMTMSALILAAFALVGTVVLAYTNIITKPKIEEQQKQFLLRSLNILIPENLRDNDIFHDVIFVKATTLFGSNKPVAVYRARLNNKPVGVIINSVAPNGYNGKIHLLVAINYNGELMGVRVSNHTETPGLGDGIDTRKSNWILSFVGKSLTNTSRTQWAVIKDGGIFDEFTGATITPRAVVKAVHNTLLYFKDHRDSLFIGDDKNLVHDNRPNHSQMKNLIDAK